jgi:predicted RNA polymerase sigma factor
VLEDHQIREFLAADYRRVLAAVALVSGSRALAEDAVQEALVRAWSRSERIEDARAWVTRVAIGTPPRASNIRQVLSGDLESSFPLVHASSDSCP